MSIAYISIGSNLGDRNKNIENALAMLKSNGIQILKTSSIIETNPAGGPPQDKFLNAVLKINTILNPEDLLKILQKIENDLGRVRTVKNGPRTIDLDILLFDNLNIQTKNLTVPHPRMFDRDFVMKPLKEIEPDIFEKFSDFKK